jgi:hypothetical protein
MHRHHRSLVLLSGLSLTLAASACGSLDANSGVSPPLATIGGAIVEAPGAPSASGNIRVAVVWRALDSGQVSVSQDLPVQPKFPSSFQIQLDIPPPASALISGQDLEALFFPTPTAGTCGIPVDGGEGCSDAAAPAVDAGLPSLADWSIGVGIVVAYEDVNDNGQLDLVANDASSYVDEIVGVNNDLAILYFQGATRGSGAPPAFPGTTGTPSLGFNLYRHVVCEAVAVDGDAGSPDAGGACPPDGFLPMTTPYDFTLTGKPEGSTIMCQSSASDMSTVHLDVHPSGSAPTGGYPAAGSAGLQCSPDGTSYTVTTCAPMTMGLCQQNVCTGDQWEAPTPVPSDWPCP